MVFGREAATLPLGQAAYVPFGCIYCPVAVRIGWAESWGWRVPGTDIKSPLMLWRIKK